MYEKAYKDASTVADKIRSNAYTGVVREPKGFFSKKIKEETNPLKSGDDNMKMVLEYMTNMRADQEEFMKELNSYIPGMNETVPDSNPEAGPMNAAKVSYTPLPKDTEWLKYSNQGKIRDKPLNDKLVSALAFLPEMGVTMEVFSGGQDSHGGKRTGSTRHDHGNAADVFFYKDGKKLSWKNPEHIPIFQDIVRRAREKGVTGFGAGDGYMQEGSMHIGFGNEAVWGAGGKGANAADWLRNA